MRDARDDQTLEVIEHAVERFWLEWRFGRNGSGNLAWNHARQHRVALRSLEVISDPLEYPFGMPPKLVRRDIAEERRVAVACIARALAFAVRRCLRRESHRCARVSSP